MSLAGAFFWGGLNVGLSLDILGSVFGLHAGDGRMVLTGRHLAVLLVYFGLHFLEYNDYFRAARQTPADASQRHPFQRWAYRYAPLWIPAGAVATLFYASWRAGGDIPFVYFQF
jgi:hypothetical protein